MPTRTETDRYKWPDDELHLIRVEPASFRGSAHAPEPAVEPVEQPVTNRETPEAVEPPERSEIGAPEAVEPPERPETPAPEAVEPPERVATSPAAASIDLFAMARARLQPLSQQPRRV